MYNPLDYDHWKEIWLVKKDDEILTVVGSFADAVAEEKRRRYQLWDETGYVPDLSVVNAENDPDWARLKKIAQKEWAAVQIIEAFRPHITKPCFSNEEWATFVELFTVYDQEI